jgi:toxin CptA
MADAPAVTYPVGPTPLLGALLALLWLAGAGGVVLMLFLAPAGAPSAPSAIILIVSLILSGLGLGAFWRSQHPGQLAWDGACWTLDGPASGQDGGGPARVQVGFDGQRVLLLRWNAPTRRRGAWLWAQASSDPVRWHLLRCALYSSGHSIARAAPLPGAERA